MCVLNCKFKKKSCRIFSTGKKISPNKGILLGIFIEYSCWVAVVSCSPVFFFICCLHLLANGGSTSEHILINLHKRILVTVAHINRYQTPPPLALYVEHTHTYFELSHGWHLETKMEEKTLLNFCSALLFFGSNTKCIVSHMKAGQAGEQQQKHIIPLMVTRCCSPFFRFVKNVVLSFFFRADPFLFYFFLCSAATHLHQVDFNANE